MISTYLREQKRYTQKDLCIKLKCSETNVVTIIRKLKEYGILKVVKASEPQRNMSDLMDEDVEVIDVEVGENEFLYVFTFVGVIIVAGRILKCYPKYLLSCEEPKTELKQVLNVLEKYNSKEQIIRMFNESSENSSFNLLAVLLFLIHDYYENGIYNNTEEIIESNGSGEILWDKTINETFTLLSNNRPYYIDLQTKKRVTNDYDYFQRLHECILTKASKEMKDSDLLDMFDITEIDLTDEVLDEFGDNEYILNQIEKELNTQFNTRKQLVLKTIYAYIAHSGNLYDTDCLSMFGTNSFNIVWEKICAEIMDNQLEKKLGELNLPNSLKPEYDKDITLKNFIEKPFWSASGRTAEETLIPDLVSITKTQFIIFDAKYYNAKFEFGKPPKGQPGIESVTKQYLYQLAYQKFIKDHGFKEVKNCFLMPTEQENVGIKGIVKLEMLEKIGLQNILIRFLPAKTAYDHYLTHKKIDLNELKLDIN